MKNSTKPDPLAPRPNLDFSKGVRGKYRNQFPKGANVAVIDPDLQAQFPDSESVNRALHAFVAIRNEIESQSGTRKTNRQAA